MKRPLSLAFLFLSLHCFSQQVSTVGAAKWVDSVFNTLNEDQRIAQLMVVRMALVVPATLLLVVDFLRE